TPAVFSEIWKSSAIVLSRPIDTNSVVPIAKEPRDIANITARRRRSPISVCRGRGRRCGIHDCTERFLTPRILQRYLCARGTPPSFGGQTHRNNKLSYKSKWLPRLRR